MPDTKELYWEGAAENGSQSDIVPEQSDDILDDVSHRKTMDTYSNWLSRAPAPARRRQKIDPTVYTWKGYRNWSDTVKRSWADRNDTD